MVQVNFQNESLFEVDKNHLDLCDIDVDGQLYVRLIKFFSAFAQHAPANVQVVSRPIAYGESEMSKLRAKSSVSSFREISSVMPDTPQGRSKETMDKQGSSSGAPKAQCESRQGSEYDLD